MEQYIALLCECYFVLGTVFLIGELINAIISKKIALTLASFYFLVFYLFSFYVTMRMTTIFH